MGYEDVGEERDARPNLGGLVFGRGFFGGRVPWGMHARILENPGTVFGGVWTAVDV
jgi:hypothetical protein